MNIHADYCFFMFFSHPDFAKLLYVPMIYIAKSKFEVFSKLWILQKFSFSSKTFKLQA